MIKQELAEALEAKARQKKENGMDYYHPYPKQQEFHAAGLSHDERLFMAANRCGKTWAGAYELAYHLTGRYPRWWKGKRFTRPIRAWVAGETAESTRDVPQFQLLGPIEDPGTGAIPKKYIEKIIRATGIPAGIDHAYIKHVTGNNSYVAFKSYGKGREKWQGETLDLIWFDEEPGSEVYDEGVTRIATTKGLVYITFTPLKGATDIVQRYQQSDNPDRCITNMTIYEAKHFTAEERERRIAKMAAHERDARAKGIPMLGSGRVFPIAEEVIKEKPIEIPEHWARIVGMDFGWDHPTAAVWFAHDRDADVIHLYDCYRVAEQPPLVHASAIRAKGDWIPVAWPHDGLQHDKGSGQQLAEIYRKEGVKMLEERATFEDGTNGVEAGIMDLLDRMQTERFKVAEHLHDWWEEFRMYHRKDGIIVSKRDDLMAATRYALMMIRKASNKHGKDNLWGTMSSRRNKSIQRNNTRLDSRWVV